MILYRLLSSSKVKFLIVRINFVVDKKARFLMVIRERWKRHCLNFNTQIYQTQRSLGRLTLGKEQIS